MSDEITVHISSKMERNMAEVRLFSENLSKALEQTQVISDEDCLQRRVKELIGPAIQTMLARGNLSWFAECVEVGFNLIFDDGRPDRQFYVYFFKGQIELREWNEPLLTFRIE